MGAQGGEQLALYEGHKHESYKLDCCLTPSDGHVICGSEDGVHSCNDLRLIPIDDARCQPHGYWSVLSLTIRAFDLR